MRLLSVSCAYSWSAQALSSRLRGHSYSTGMHCDKYVAICGVLGGSMARQASDAWASALSLFLALYIVFPLPPGQRDDHSLARRRSARARLPRWFSCFGGRPRSGCTFSFEARLFLFCAFSAVLSRDSFLSSDLMAIHHSDSSVFPPPTFHAAH